MHIKINTAIYRYAQELKILVSNQLWSTSVKLVTTDFVDYETSLA